MGFAYRKKEGTARRIAVCVFFAACVMLLSCSPASGAEGGAIASQSASGVSGGQYSVPKEAVLPKVAADESNPIDTSHVEDGYVSAAAKSPATLKFQVKKDDVAYNYDLPNDGTPMVYPVNMGDGEYLFRIMENTDGSNYAELEAVEEKVKLASEFAPYLVPNQFCNYTAKSECVKKARELSAAAQSQTDVLNAVCYHVVQNVTYDHDKAQKLSTGTGYVPNPDETLQTGKGVCFDYASLGAAMLRSLGLPTKIVTGYVSPGDIYHAWIMVYVDNEWKTAEFSVDPKTWSRVDLTFVSSGTTQFTGNGGSYTDRYVY